MSRDSQGRFEKGFTGNPCGRPRKVKRALADINHKEEFIAATEEEFSATLGGKVRKTSAIDLINKQLIRKAVGGDVRCILKVLDMRESYDEAHRKQTVELFEAYLKKRDEVRRNPDDYTQETFDAMRGAEEQFARTFPG
jgi:replication-associated recombination protein RarA